MNTNPQSSDAATRLSTALNSVSDLACSQAEELLPALIEAEAAGADVDHDPVFAALVQHLDHCPDCLDLYEQMAADMATLVEEPTPAPPISVKPPTFFAPPIAKGNFMWLEVLHGLGRRFSLKIDLPRLAPMVPTLSGGHQSLFADRLHEIEGHPLLAITIGQDTQGQWLQVAILDLPQSTRWSLHLLMGTQRVAAETDERGLVRFNLPSDTQLESLQIICEALPVS